MKSTSLACQEHSLKWYMCVCILFLGFELRPPVWQSGINISKNRQSESAWLDGKWSRIHICILTAKASRILWDKGPSEELYLMTGDHLLLVHCLIFEKKVHKVMISQ
ncbi:hypothetical protein CHS0354_020216 [Potamilus streckersoni]|uniref:Uncharacterized protein n=1 Tax=Potamilus streckersoni TaxID=2493646 RepID=A0AAE0SK32_9BIVA|nr:hypothetical protein CHS0354_020216 [Potamilus streckersoni]